jgi:putative aminopeptidase FrvX
LIDFFQSSTEIKNRELKIIQGEHFQDNLIIIKGDPKVALYAHMDTVGFTVRYENQLVPVGGPQINQGDIVVGNDHLGPIECQVNIDEDNRVTHDFERAIARGTPLTYQPNFRIENNYIESPYLDNRLGIFNAIKCGLRAEDVALVFTCWEEHGGGSVPMLARYLYETHNIKQALISDITWVTDGITFEKGPVISLRDKNIPRKLFIDRILMLSDSWGGSYQLEVEATGSSDGRELQLSPYPIDWCFIGAPHTNSHSPRERANIEDILQTVNLYSYLVDHL